jgi:predicted nucleic acid-binding protein
VPIDDELLDAAAALDPRVLRSLDAIHLAAALLFDGELTALVTYDRWPPLRDYSTWRSPLRGDRRRPS